jgi:predicted transcriptional regulator
MKRTTLALSDDLAAALAREARRSNRSASEVAREALARYLGLAGEGPRELAFAAVGRSGRNTVGRDMEEHLAEWDDVARGR